MGQISIRLSNEVEVELRKKVMAEKKSLAEYCREKILTEEFHPKNSRLHFSQSSQKYVQHSALAILTQFLHLEN